jgi:protein SCO1/2
VPNMLQKLRQWPVAVSIATSVLLSGCNRAEPWRLVDMDNRLPSLAFNMTNANPTGPVTAANFRGKIVVLEFGYTSCPDVCPTTLANLTRVLRDLGNKAQDIRVLFVTVDPERDNLNELKQYVGNFAPQVVGLRGTPNQLATLARRYRVAYSVTRAANPADIEVMHTPTLFIFGRDGRSRLLSPRIDDISGIEHDLRQLVDERRIAERDSTP